MALQIVAPFFFMQYKFSQELREKLIAYFLRKNQVEVSQEQADEYLDSMADLYSAFSQENAEE